MTLEQKLEKIFAEHYCVTTVEMFGTRLANINMIAKGGEHGQIEFNFTTGKLDELISQIRLYYDGGKEV